MPIRLALVNDHELVVRGLADMLRNYRDEIDIIELTAEMSVASKVDIALYDTFAMRQGDTESVADLVRSRRVQRTVVYTWNLSNAMAEATLAQGVSGYLSKSLVASELVDALRRVHAGQRVVMPMPDRTQPVGGDWPGREEGLTARESEVLALITEGLSNAEIVERTSLSINSIKSYIRTCYRKIDATSRSQAVLWGVRHGFLPDRVRITDPRLIPGGETDSTAS